MSPATRHTLWRNTAFVMKIVWLTDDYCFSRYMAPEPVEDKSDKDVSVPDYRNCWQILSCEPNCTAADGNVSIELVLTNM